MRLHFKIRGISGLIFLYICLFCSSLLHADELQFEGFNKTPINFVPFEVKDGNGNSLSGQTTASMNMLDDQTRNLQSSVRGATDNFTNAGYDIVNKSRSLISEGQEISVGQYLNELNGAEAKLNSYGYSLRDELSVKTHELQKVDRTAVGDQVSAAAELYTDELKDRYTEKKQQVDAELAKAKEAIAEAGSRLKGSGDNSIFFYADDRQCSADLASSAKCHLSSIDRSAVASTPDIEPKPDSCAGSSMALGKAYLIGDSWNDGGGDNMFGWLGSASFALKTDVDGLSAEIKANASISALGSSIKVLGGEAVLVSSPREGGSVSREVVIFDKTVDQRRESAKTDLGSSKNDRGEELYLFSEEENVASTTIVLGFIPVLLALDAKTTSGPTYDADLVPVKVKGKGNYIQKITMIASAGLGADLKLFVVLAGIKGYIDLINASLGGYPEAGLVMDDQNRPEVSGRLSALASLSTLSGEIDLGVWAKSTVALPQPTKSFPFIEVKPIDYNWSKTIGKYPGYAFPVAVIFDKKVGYDVCSGRKEITTVVPNQPRPRDERGNYELAEAQRIEGLVTKFIQIYDEHKSDGRDEAVGAAVDNIVKRLDQTSLLIKQTALSHLSN